MKKRLPKFRSPSSGALLLAVDAGNTSVTLGFFSGEKLLAQGRIFTTGSRTAQEPTRALKRLLRSLSIPPERIEGVILSSVVPRATAALKRALQGLIRAQVLVVGKDIQAPVRNRYRIPGQVGQDRLVNAAAALHLYGGPAVVVDFGTAVTVDLVTRRGDYLGGMIAPGIEIALEALTARAALLPAISLTPPREFLGRDTRSSMRSGIFHGYGALCDGLVAGLKKRYAPGAMVIATGGHSPLIAPFCRSVQIVNPQLTLQGLRVTYQKAA